MAGVLTPQRTTYLRRRVRLLVGGVLVYNVVVAGTAITAGALASSTALVGFGLDAVVEVTSALAITWQYAHHTPPEREHRALQIVAYSFFALAAYVSIDAVVSLTTGREAAPSPLGIGLAALSLLIMPIASLVERRTGEELGSASVIADSKQLLLCSYLSAVLLAGLVINSTLGWSWADPVAGLLIALLAVREGREALRGDSVLRTPRPPALRTRCVRRRMWLVKVNARDLRVAYRSERDEAQRAFAAGAGARGWRHLERAHVLAQPLMTTSWSPATLNRSPRFESGCLHSGQSMIAPQVRFTTAPVMAPAWSDPRNAAALATSSRRGRRPVNVSLSNGSRSRVDMSGAVSGIKFGRNATTRTP